MSFINSSPFKYLLVFIYVCIATYFVRYTNSFSFFGIDDANIYMVYMRNLADGHGFVYNIGGERVEGFTSLLWTLIGAVIYHFTKSPEIFLLVFNMIIVSYTLWRVVDYIDSHKKTKTFIFSIESFTLLALLLLMPGFFDWTLLSLMETGLWFSLLTLTTLWLIKFDPKTEGSNFSREFSVLLILLILCRPEAMLWSFFFVLCYGLKVYILMSKSILKAFLKSGSYLFVTIGSLVGLTLWRLWYFGYPFPNTYYAKVSSSLIENIELGWRYFTKGFAHYPIIIGILIVAPLFFAIRYKKSSPFLRSTILFSFGVFVISLSIPFLTGGDHFGYSRFYQATLPIGLLCLLLSFSNLNVKFRFIYLIILIGLIYNYSENNFAENYNEQKTDISYEWLLVEQGRKRSNDLNKFFEGEDPMPSQGVLIAGSHAFTYKGFTNDLLGLNNVEMAHRNAYKDKDLGKNHASFNKEVFYEQQPDIFWYGSYYINPKDSTRFKITPSGIQKRVFKNIHKDDEFKALYKPVIITSKNVGYALRIMASRAFIEQLDKDKFTVIETTVAQD